jgi:AcrR family transcriptional regulator
MTNMVSKVGLHERKKLAAMRRIQNAALDLFDERGYEGVTIEQIAEVAEVSPSSVYRYFGTKEQVVLWDETDLRFSDVFEKEIVVHPPVEAVRRAIARVMADFFERDEEAVRRKTGYFLKEPALRSAWLEQADWLANTVAEALARGSGHEVVSLDVQVIAAALTWSLVAAISHWHANGFAGPLRDEFDRALAILEGGLQLT